ncbi:MAG: 3'-5' exonuclease [Candidatus Peribacteraceae bacterium]|nr:3'-5' exonuclease [Candidatus Peribacteraceae bacterium]
MIFCVLDTETTGLQAGHHEVIQVAAILCTARLNEIDKVSFKIQPQCIETANKRALEITGYHPDTWGADFFSHKEALEHLNKFIEKNNSNGDIVIMTGQNIKFDYGFLTAEYSKAGVFFPFSSKTLDLIMVAKIWSSTRNVKLKRHSLQYLAEFTKQVNTRPHDAAADADVTLDILKWFVNDLKNGSKNDKKRFRKYSSLKI